MQHLQTPEGRQLAGVEEPVIWDASSSPALSTAPDRSEVTSENPLCVIHLIKHCGYGNGNVHVAVDLACVQADAGYQVTIVSAGGTFEPLLDKHRVRHIKLNHDQNKPLSVLRASWKLVRYVRNMKADILHAHMMSSALVGYVVSKLTGVPLITTVHNSFDRHSTIMRLGQRVVAVSRAERESLLSRGFASDRVDVVMNAPVMSPRESFMKDESQPSISSPCITTVCGLHHRKRVFDLIAACEMLFVDMPRWHLYIAGEGPDLEALKEQARAAGIEANVIFLGFVRDPMPLLRQSDIFALASESEPFGLSVAEARAAGCAIVATNVGGIPEVLDYGRAGRLVPPGRPDELASELRDLMTNQEVRLQMQRSALSGSESFHVHRLIGDYESVYMRAHGRVG
jgi:glycosyltransferase involved in cell wall biosynthesis